MTTWQYSPYAVLLVATAALSGLLAYLCWRRRSAPGGAAAVAILLAGAVYCLGYALELSSTSLAAMDTWSKVQYAGIAAIPAALLSFVLGYSGHPQARNRRLMLLLSIVPVLTFTLRATNEWHHWVYASVELGKCHSLVIQIIHPGPYYWFQLVYLYVAVIISGVLLLRVLWHSFRQYQAQVIVLLFGLAGPSVANVLYLLRLGPFPGLDLGPLGFSVTTLSIAWCLLSLHLLDIMPIAQEFVMEGMADGVLVLDLQRRVVHMNSSAAQLLGPAAQRWMGRPLQELASFWPEFVVGLLDRDNASLMLQQQREGEQRFFDVRVSVARDWQQQAVCRIVVLRDITEFRRAEEQKQRLEEQLRQAQKLEAVAILASGVAHEFNNLLTVIQGRTELSLGVAELPASLQEDLQAVQRAAMRAAEITQRLLAFSQRQPLHSQELHLNTTVQEFAALLAAALSEKVHLELSMSPDMPPLVADAVALQQALMNLSLNACDAMPEGGILRVATSRACVGSDFVLHSGKSLTELSGAILRTGEVKSGEYALLSAEDNGTGMNQETLSHIFEPFFTTKPVGKGTGLGLPVVYGIVTQHHGWIQVESALGRGTRVSILLPISREDPQTCGVRQVS